MTNEEAIEILTDVKNTPGIIWTNGADAAIELAIESLKNKPDYDIIFLCDGEACGKDHDCMGCRHTSDICHAKNFHYNPVPVLSDKNYYLEADNEQ